MLFLQNKMDEILKIVVKGILIGLCISVPLGPIGMLCVQRTLNKGRKHGFVTGLGASASDLLYIIITLFFLSFVLNFISTNEFLFQLLGSILVCVFGVFIFRNNPSAQPKVQEKPNNSLFGDAFSAFALTLSNPLILFVLIALFARFNFVDNESDLAEIIIGIVSILTGATAWWVMLTFIVSRFRKYLSFELKVINRITGIIIILIGIFGFLISYL
jgi:threonine/homoserine/homoserine lactone efflux protein